MNCPICQKQIQGQLLECDIFSEHIRSNQCNISQFMEDTLDLYQLLPSDILLLVQLCSSLKNLKHLYLTQQYNTKFQKMTEYIIPQTLIQISQNQFQKIPVEQQKEFLESLKKIQAKDQIVQITIPPKVKLDDAMLLIPFEQYSEKIVAITLAKRDTIPIQKTQLYDIDQLLQHNGIFLNDKTYQYALTQINQSFKLNEEQFIYNVFEPFIINQEHIQQQNNDQTFDLIQLKRIHKIKSQRSQGSSNQLLSAKIGDIKKQISKQEVNSFVTAQQMENIDNIDQMIIEQEYDEQQLKLEQQKEQNQLQSYNNYFNQISAGMQKLKNQIYNYFQNNDSKEGYDGIMFDQIKRNIHLVVERRLSSTINRMDYKQVLITLLPKLESIDGVRITPEQRSEALEYCYSKYSLPHKQMFPKLIVQSEQGFKQFLKYFLQQQNQKVVIQKTCTPALAINNYKRWHLDKKLAIKYPQQQQTYSIDSQQSIKASIMNKSIMPKIICITSNYQNPYVINKQNKNLSVFMNKKLNYGRYTVIHKLEQYILLGTERGNIFALNPESTFQDQLDENHCINEIGETIPSFPLTMSPFIYKDSMQKRITSICHQQQNVIFSSYDGAIFVQDINKLLQNKPITQANNQIQDFNVIVNCGFAPTSLDNRDSNVLITGQGGCLLYDVQKQQFQNFFTYPLNGSFQSYFQQNKQQDPGYYDITASKYTSDNSIITGDATGCLRLIDIRSKDYITIQLPHNIAVSSLDVNSTSVICSQYDSRLTSFDIRMPDKQNNINIPKIRGINNSSEARFLSSKKVILSIPSASQIKIFDYLQYKIVDEFQLDFLSKQKSVIQKIEPINQQDFSFILKFSVESEVFTVKSMDK